MAGIKFGAHPMVVAVAMGLLGPGALLEEQREGHEDTTRTSADAPDEIEAPSPDEFARVEDLWHSVRTKV